MSLDFVIHRENNPQIFQLVGYKDSKTTVTLDFSPWAEDNNNVTSVTWEVPAGSATVSGQTLASNVASALVTLPNQGGSLIKITAATGTETYVTYISVLSRDPETVLTDDYGFPL